VIVAVAADGYVQAADAFRSGNHAAADAHHRLVTGLASTGAMAGDDASAAEFAAAYDRAAAETVAALADVVTAYATLRRLTTDSAAHHQRAEEGSIIPGGVIPGDCLAAPLDADRSVLPAVPPSSLGGDPPTLTPQEAWILDHIEGFVWPDADVDRLRRAAQTWRAAGAGLDDAAAYCGLAAQSLETQRSPEIPLALAAASDLRATIRALASSCDDLGADCEAYADAVEARHAEIRALLHEILQLVVEGMVIGAALAAVTAGAGAAVALGSVAARVAAQAPRFAAILAALRAATAGIAASVRSTHATVQLHRARLERFLRVPARNQRGAFALGRPGRQPGWLKAHEHSGSHTISRHVGKTREQLLKRTRTYDLDAASSFPSQSTAERLIEGVLRKHSDDVTAWLSSPKGKLAIEDMSDFPTGVTGFASGDFRSVHGVRVVLQRDESMEDGYRILTSYPQP